MRSAKAMPTYNRQEHVIHKTRRDVSPALGCVLRACTAAGCSITYIFFVVFSLLVQFREFQHESNAETIDFQIRLGECLLETCQIQAVHLNKLAKDPGYLWRPAVKESPS
jgi:hypothetical protein